MLKFLRSFLSSGNAVNSESLASLSIEPPGEVAAPGVDAFPLESHLSQVEGLPYLDWQAVARWLESIEPPEVRAKAWSDCEIAWLLHLKAALGHSFTLSQQGDAVLLSGLEPNIVRVALEYMSRTSRRIQRVLDGIVQIPEWGKDILIVFDDEDTYYRYVSHYYPEGEFAGSSGMYIGQGCGHFVTMNADLSAIEPVIAHEMTHGCLGHLPIPLWLNEGLAVNTERRVSRATPALYTPREIQQKHLRYWNASKIQEFWSGKSFLRTDDGNLLSYDLAQKIVEQLASNWDVFRAFVLSADVADGGASAAIEQFNLDLGEVAAVLIGCAPCPDWTPDRGTWPADPANGDLVEPVGQPCGPAGGAKADVLAQSPRIRGHQLS